MEIWRVEGLIKDISGVSLLRSYICEHRQRLFLFKKKWRQMKTIYSTVTVKLFKCGDKVLKCCVVKSGNIKVFK